MGRPGVTCPPRAALRTARPSPPTLIAHKMMQSRGGGAQFRPNMLTPHHYKCRIARNRDFVGCGGVDLNHDLWVMRSVGNCKLKYFAAQMTTHEDA